MPAPVIVENVVNGTNGVKAAAASATTTTPRYDHILHFPQTAPVTTPPNAWRIAQEWLAQLQAVFASQTFSGLNKLFHEDSWWRDILALQWDLRSIHGRGAIEAFLEEHKLAGPLTKLRLQADGQFQPQLETVEDAGTGLQWISSLFHYETRVGHGSGVLRLTQERPGEWKAYAVYTTLQSLRDFPEPLDARRPYGTTDRMPGGIAGGTWSERRSRDVEFTESEPEVLVIGAGQAGLNVSARLQQLGLSVLVVDKNDRVGDNWRNRYRTLVTHDPAEFTHMAYLPFPRNWPQFTPKDKLGDWFEAYASLMELNVWTKTTVGAAVFDEAAGQWTVELVRQGSPRTVKPRHVVFCTGHAGEPKIPTFPGQAAFKGRVYHGSQHEDAGRLGVDLTGKKVVVVGTGNSGHDIAENFYEAGADVTMLQRRGTYVLSLDRGVFMLHAGMHEDGGAPTEQCDIVGESLPYPVMLALCRGMTKRIAQADAPLLDGLARAGFQLDWGVDGGGIARLYFTRGGGYYVDVGCSQLIIDGKIKVQQAAGIDHFTEDGLVLADGSTLSADVVVLATGFDNMKTTVTKVLGETVAARCKDVWDLDAEGELNAMWRPSGHPRFWFMGGNLALCRIYSKYVALQIKAEEAGLKK